MGIWVIAKINIIPGNCLHHLFKTFCSIYRLYIGAIIRMKQLLLTSKWRLNQGGRIIRTFTVPTTTVRNYRKFPSEPNDALGIFHMSWGGEFEGISVCLSMLLVFICCVILSSNIILVIFFITWPYPRNRYRYRLKEIIILHWQALGKVTFF